MSKGIPWRDVLAKDLEDPEFRAEWEASAVGRALGLWLIQYRNEHGLEFDQLASQLGIAREALLDLESGDEDPPAATLLLLSRALRTPLILRVERGLPGGTAEIISVDATAAIAA